MCFALYVHGGIKGRVQQRWYSGVMTEGRAITIQETSHFFYECRYGLEPVLLGNHPDARRRHVCTYVVSVCVMEEAVSLQEVMNTIGHETGSLITIIIPCFAKKMSTLRQPKKGWSSVSTSKQTNNQESQLSKAPSQGEREGHDRHSKGLGCDEFKDKRDISLINDGE